MRHKRVTQPGMQNKEMYLHKRSNGFWYFRRRLPSDLLGMIEPKRFHYSLGTKNKSEALLRLSGALAESEQIIRKERDRLNQAPAIVKPRRWQKRRIDAERAKRRRTRVFCQYNESAILDLVSRWFRKEVRKTEDLYRHSFALNNAEEREEILKDLDNELAYLRGELEPMDGLIGFREVQLILEEEDCAIPPDCLQDQLFLKFYGLVRQGLLRLNEISVALIETGTLPQSRNGENDLAIPSAVFASNGPIRSITLDELIERFEHDPRRQHLREATREEYQLIYRGLREQIGGETPIRSITREMIREIADTFRNLPSRATLQSKVPLQQLATDAKTRGLPQAHVKTYNKKVQQVSALFRYAVAEQLLLQNPATNLSLPEPPGSGEDMGFTLDQLRVIFSGDFFARFLNEPGSQFVPNHPLRPCYFWAPLIGLFHGWRSGEILQLKTANV